MDRYDQLDLECDDDHSRGSVSQKAAMFGGMFKRSSKCVDPSLQVQDGLSASNELSNSNDSLTENKEKGGMFKGILEKNTRPAMETTASQASLSVPNTDLSAGSDGITDNNLPKERTGVLGGIFRRSPRSGQDRRPSQDNLSIGDELGASNDSLVEVKEKGGVFSGMFKKSKPSSVGTQSQEDLSASSSELSASNDNLSENNNTKEKGGVFSAMFKKSKPTGVGTQSQEDLSASSSELSASTDNLSENNNTKEKGGMFGGMFRKPKALGDKTKSQEDLSANGQLSVSTDSLTEKTSKGGMMGKILRNPFQSSAQEKERAESSVVSSAENSNTKQEKSSDSDGELLDNEQSTQKQNKFVGAMNKLNPFRGANKYEKAAEEEDEEPSDHKQKDSECSEALTENQRKGEEKPKTVKGNMIHQDRKERGESPQIPDRPREEELKQTTSYQALRGGKTTDHQENKNMIPRERKGRGAGAEVRHAVQKPKKDNQSDDEGLREDEREDGSTTESKTVKKPKRNNPFMPRAGPKAQSDDEGLKDDETLSTKENKEENQDKQEETKVGKSQKPKPFMPRAKQAQSDDEGLGEETSLTEDSKTKVKRPKKHNPFMPRVKAKAEQKKEAATAQEMAENENASRPLFERLEELRINRTEPEEMQDFEGLMEWWRTVEKWEDVTEDEDMTEKEEAKAFAVTADKVQKGIRVFNKLFSERAEDLWQHVIDLNAIADNLDKFNKKTKIAQITGGSTSAVGGVATIVGLALAPVTMGTSLIVTAVGLGVATAGGLTSGGAGISNQVNNSMDRKKVEKIVEDYQEKMTDLNKCMLFIKQGIEHLRKFDLLKMRKHAYNRDFPALNSNFYEDGAMAGKAILINANEIMRVVQIANVAGSTAARAVQIASMATGVLTGLFVGMDIYFVAKDSKELKKGAKSEFAAKIREVAQQLHEGLVELNTIREELHSTESTGGDDTATSDKAKKEAADEKPDSSEEEDEIDRIKKAIKKDYENREYV